ncbi:MAG: hypothetical protein Q4B70_15545, partial [Lachnospiraceae bacterium]|nr:hypothetical protein [Lachnospiraceae bacterium]
IKEDYGYTEEIAKKFHNDMQIFTYGIAMQANTGYYDYPDEEINELLHREFMALTGIYGPPPKYVNQKKKK